MVSTSTKILLLGASALAVGGLATKYKVGTGLSTLGTGTTEFLLAGPRAGARTVSLFVGAGQEALGFTREVGGALSELKGILDSITGANGSKEEFQKSCLYPIPLDEPCPDTHPHRRIEGDDKDKCCNTVNPTREGERDEEIVQPLGSVDDPHPRGDAEICGFIGTGTPTEPPIKPCVRVLSEETRAIIQGEHDFYTPQDIHSGRIGVRG